MITRILIAIVVGIAVYLGWLLLGKLLGLTEIELAEVIGAFLVKYASVLGLVAGLYEFATGGLSTMVRK